MADSITLHPNAKINLGLHITGRRTDGYHLLETVFWPVHELADSLTITEAASLSTPTLDLTGAELNGAAADNLVMRAWQALRAIVPTLPAVHIQLVKRIPAGAGLGGGSADAAFMLVGLNQLFSLSLSTHQLREIALPLGADVPFFVENRPMIATGIGELLAPLDLDLSAYQIVLNTPAIHSDTRVAYRGLLPRHWSGNRQLAELLRRPVQAWRGEVRNDFEPSVFERYPALGALKNAHYSKGAVYASMSGSGSAVYGIYERSS